MIVSVNGDVVNVFGDSGESQADHDGGGGGGGAWT